MHTFKAALEIIGINPYVLLPASLLEALFKEAGKDKGPIPVKGKINGKEYKQTLVKFKGAWRLYINTTILKNSPKRIGEVLELSIEHDPEKRVIPPHPGFVKALNENKEAASVFHNLRPSLQLEIVRYLSSLKTQESVDRNIPKAIAFLLGKGRFVGRTHP